MHDHVSPKRMEDFCARALDEEAFREIASQISHCEECLRSFRETLRKRRESAPVSIDLTAESWFGLDHLDREQMEIYLAGRLDEIEKEMAETHLEICGACREQLASIKQERPATESDGRAGAV